MSLGCYSSAVEIFERLELWEELALCYIATDRRAKAKHLIQKQLDTHATPTLLCLMGDITQVHIILCVSCHGNYHLFNVSCLSILVNVSI